MEYGINIGYFSRYLGLERSAELICKAGFTKLDYTPRVKNDNWREELSEAMKLFDALGLTVHQTHVPFNRYGAYGKAHATCVARCFEATEILGAKYAVAHGDEFDFENMTFSPEAALEYNRKMYLPYVEGGKAAGYKVAFETVFEDSFLNRRRYTSRADELRKFIDSFNSESAVCCWDFGHAHVSFGNDAPSVARDFGSLIECTHLHDNTGIDAHSFPLIGDINWKETMRAFKDINYCGVMSVEYAHGEIPEHLCEDFLKLTYNAAKYLWEL